MKFMLAALLAAASITGCSKGSNKEPEKVEADNTAKNERKTPTADNAVAQSSDLDVTQKIRKAVMDDDTLSTNAHNSKIVVQDGKVTLVGPVASAEESTRMAKIAASIVGEQNVTNQLEVTN